MMSDELTLTTTQAGGAAVLAETVQPSQRPRPPYDSETHERLAARIEAEGYRVFWGEDARAWTRQHFGEWYARLTAAERRGLETYVARGKVIGSHLRAGDGWGRGFIQDIDSMLDEVRTPEAVALTRLWSIRPNPMLESQLTALRPGDVFTDRAFLSTSTAWTWGLQEVFQNELLCPLHSVILVPAGARLLPMWGRYIPSVTICGCEFPLALPQLDPWRHEILLPRDLPLRLLEQPAAENCYRFIFAALDETAERGLGTS